MSLHAHAGTGAACVLILAAVPMLGAAPGPADSGKTFQAPGGLYYEVRAPYRRVFLSDGVLLPGQSIVETLRFRRPPGAPPVSYTLTLLSGQGIP